MAFREGKQSLVMVRSLRSCILPTSRGFLRFFPTFVPEASVIFCSLWVSTAFRFQPKRSKVPWRGDLVMPAYPILHLLPPPSIPMLHPPRAMVCMRV